MPKELNAAKIAKQGSSKNCKLVKGVYKLSNQQKIRKIKVAICYKKAKIANIYRKAANNSYRY